METWKWLSTIASDYVEFMHFISIIGSHNDPLFFEDTK
jgi:hypothetical protein